ncbi:MAG: head GIN domain-containing protein [Ginsengibacter sp.]
MKLLLIAVFTSFGLVSFSQKVINDVNAAVRNVSAFSGIKVSGGIDVYLSQSENYALAVSASDDKYRENIKTEIRDGILTIWFDSDNFRWMRGDKKLRAYISFKDIQSLEASGACSIKIEDQMNTGSFSLRLSGACDISGNLKVSDMFMDLSGASTVKLEGAVENLKIECSGASDVKDYDLQVENCVAKISGASDVKISINKSISASASGASSLKYKGNPDKRDVATSGASSISQRNN